MKMRFRFSALYLILLILCLPYLSLSQAKEGVTIYNFPQSSNSARVNAMGGCSINLVDEQSAFHNPGAAGLFYLTKSLSMTVPFPVKVNPFAEEVTANSVGIGYKLPLKFLAESNKAPVETCLGISYYYSHLKIDEYPLTDYYYPLGIDSFGSPRYYSASNNLHALSLGFGWRVKRFQLGFGYTMKAFFDQVESIDASGIGHDLGLVAKMTLPNKVKDNINEKIDVSVALVIANIGSDLNFIGQQHPLPKTNRLGLGAKYFFENNGEILFYLHPIVQCDNWLIEWDDKYFRFGLETGVMDILFGRAGKIKGNVDLDWGCGISLMNAYRKFFGKNHHSDSTGFIDHLKENLDIKFDYARAKSQYPDAINFYKITLSL